MRDC